ncbi:MAG: hypothetical protein KC766_42030 [Myxococcales bacterium]|nr:hypothetical protein [Myxococcales bacterium]
MRALDLRQVLRAAYRLDGDDGDWLRELANAAVPGLPPGVAVIAYTCRLADDVAVEIDNLLLGFGDPQFLDIVPRVLRAMDPVDIRAWFGRGYASTSEVFQRALPEESLHAGVPDFLGANTVDANGSGLVIGVALSERTRTAPRERVLWSRAMAHVSSAYRLRRGLRRCPTGAEAIFGLQGAVEHAEKHLKDSKASSRLRAAVLARSAALEAPRADQALETWQALVDGRWSLVDVFESDGKRYVAAYRNRVEPRFTLALTRRQREVVELVGRGLNNGQIAYRLGVTESSVASHLQVARHKLGVRSTTELVSVFRTLTHPERRHGELLGGLQVVRACSASRRGSLTNAEMAVCELVGRGMTNEQIGCERGVSPRTVANQIASILDKLGLRSRREIASL